MVSSSICSSILPVSLSPPSPPSCMNLHHLFLPPFSFVLLSFISNPAHRHVPYTTTAHHLSPQALKWKEYRRRNPLGVDRLPLGHSATLEQRGGGGLQRPPRRNVFDFPSSLPGHALGRLHGAPLSLSRWNFGRMSSSQTVQKCCDSDKYCVFRCHLRVRGMKFERKPSI